jgi:hypothetical protein
MTCGVVPTSISGCDVCTAGRVVCDYTGAFVGEKYLDVIKMHGTTIKIIPHGFF